MSRFRLLSVVAMVASAVAVPIVSSGGGAAVAAPACSLPAAVGGVITLTGSCDTTAPLTIPNGDTLNGAGFTITAHDSPTGGFFVGGVVTSAVGGSMNVENLTIMGTGFNPVPACGRGMLFGIWFHDASGSVSNVKIENITESSGCPPNVGIGIRADGITAPRTVNITGTTVTGYMRNGLDARCSMTMNVTGSTIGPPENPHTLGQNGIVYVNSATEPTSSTTVCTGLSPSGTVSNSTVYGSGDNSQGNSTEAIIMQGAKNVTITHNTMTSNPAQPGSDIGVWALSGAGGTPSTGIVISFNHVARSTPDNPDLDGFGIVVCSSTAGRLADECFPDVPASSATLICNTFAGWNGNILGALQISCTPLPNGTECHAYSANVFSVQGGIGPYTWSVVSGSLPPGLKMSPSDGAITGTPTKAGTFKFTVQVADSSPPPLTASQEQTVTIAPDCAAPATTTTTTTTPGTTTAPAAGTAPITNTTVPVTG